MKYFRKVNEDELDSVFKLYNSVKGEEFCIWNENYPGIEEIEYDFKTENLYGLFDEKIFIGALSVVPENEMDDFSVWKPSIGTVNEIARVVIDKKYRGNGYAAYMVTKIIEILKSSGCTSIHLSVAEKNIPALKTYQKVGFEYVGETDMYGNHFRLFEKSI